MTWFLTLVPMALLLYFHFHGQTSESVVRLASNLWLIFYVVGYFLPIPLFVEGEDGWSTVWDYSFRDKDVSLQIAVLLAFVGGLVLSACTREYGIRIRSNQSDPTPVRGYIFSGRRALLVFFVALSSLFVGVYLVGGLWTLMEGLGDRISLFAGFNALFLPVNMLIGVCFALSAARALGQDIPRWSEVLAIAATLPALFLLGQKSNIFILVAGLAMIKASTVERVRFWLLAMAALLVANLLLFYEFLFREALIIGVDPNRLTIDGWLTYAMTQITGNFMQIQNLAVLVEAMPDALPYVWGDTYLAFFVLIIPKVFIEVKPLSAAGVYTLAFWPEIVARESTTMPPGLFGEAYMNFGPLGFIGACGVVGALLRRVDRPWRQRRQRNTFELVLVATAGAVSLHFIRGEFFAPMLILVGVLVGARATLVAWSYQKPVSILCTGPNTREI